MKLRIGSVKNASLSNKIAAANILGMAILAAALLFLYQTTFSSYAENQAQKYQESAMRVAWNMLGQYGGSFTSPTASCGPAAVRSAISTNRSIA